MFSAQKIKKLLILSIASGLLMFVKFGNASAATITATAIDKETIEVRVDGVPYLYTNNPGKKDLSPDLLVRIDSSGGFWSNCVPSTQPNSLNYGSQTYAQIKLDASKVTSDTIKGLNISYCNVYPDGTIYSTPASVDLINAKRLTGSSPAVTPGTKYPPATWLGQNAIKFQSATFWDIQGDQGGPFYDLSGTACSFKNIIKLGAYDKTKKQYSATYTKSWEENGGCKEQPDTIVVTGEKPSKDVDYPGDGTKAVWNAGYSVKFKEIIFVDNNTGNNIDSKDSMGCKVILYDYRKSNPRMTVNYKDLLGKCQPYIGGENTVPIAIVPSKLADVLYQWIDDTSIKDVRRNKVFSQKGEDYPNKANNCDILKKPTIATTGDYDTAMYIEGSVSSQDSTKCDQKNPIEVKILKLSAAKDKGITCDADGKCTTVTPGSDPAIPSYDPCASGEACSKECNDDGKGSCFYNVLQTIINFFSAGIGIVVVINIILGGIQYIMADGNAGDAAKGRARIQNSLMGIAAYAIMFGVMSWLIPGGIGG